MVDVPASKETAALAAALTSLTTRMGTAKPVPVPAARRCRPLFPIAFFAAFMFSTMTILSALPPVPKDATESMRQELRQQLVEKGATLYGVSSCAYTQKQLADLGTTEHFTQGLDYVDCDVEAAFCQQMNVTLHPTWQINGQLYPEYYSVEKLSEKLSGDDEVDGHKEATKIFRYTFSVIVLLLSWSFSWWIVAIVLLNSIVSC